uniref:Uncharacterized protein n=1 Tax=Lepeophtheirus salmonis TaxID=72036 RepID=A0A0K2V2D1_LEPSM
MAVVFPLKDFIGLGQSNDPLNMYSFRINFSLINGSCPLKLINPSHRGWSIHFNILIGK